MEMSEAVNSLTSVTLLNFPLHKPQTIKDDICCPLLLWGISQNIPTTSPWLCMPKGRSTKSSFTQGPRGADLLFWALLALPHPWLDPPHPTANLGMETLTRAPAGMVHPGTPCGHDTEGEFSQGRGGGGRVLGGGGDVGSHQWERCGDPDVPSPSTAWPSLGRKKKELVPRITCFAFLRCLQGNFD